MSPRSKRELIRAMRERYLQASRKAKGAILTELCAATGMHRKAAIRCLRRPPVDEAARTAARRSGRRARYPAALRPILGLLWEAMGRPWSVRLRAGLPLWLPALRRRQPIPEPFIELLLTISARTIDRLLASARRQAGRRQFGRTKPGTLLRREIPIQTAAWQTGLPGYTEMDLVSHSGPNAAGEFLHTLNLTDIESTWVESCALLGKSEVGVLRALGEIAAALPFDLKGVDSDNGSEFVNHQMLRYCHERGILFTRSRPYKKDDNAHIEQKNWTHVRRILGWDRYDSPDAREEIHHLYRHELRLMMNLFQPAVRLIARQRVGARSVRKYDAPKTPLDRLLANGNGNADRIAQFVELREQIDPFELAAKIDEKLARIYALATLPSRGAESAARLPAA